MPSLELRDHWNGKVTEPDPNIVKSSLSRMVTRDGITVEVEIIRLEGETGVVARSRQR